MTQRLASARLVPVGGPPATSERKASATAPNQSG